MKNVDLACTHPGALTNPTLLTKSRYLSGLQCPKLLWFQCRRTDQVPQSDDATSTSFEEGREVGELARRLFPGGTLATKCPIDAELSEGQTDGALRAGLGRPCARSTCACAACQNFLEAVARRCPHAADSERPPRATPGSSIPTGCL
jgi:hypothetical protein